MLPDPAIENSTKSASIAPTLRSPDPAISPLKLSLATRSTLIPPDPAIDAALSLGTVTAILVGSHCCSSPCGTRGSCVRGSAGDCPSPRRPAARYPFAGRWRGRWRQSRCGHRRHNGRRLRSVRMHRPDNRAGPSARPILAGSERMLPIPPLRRGWHLLQSLYAFETSLMLCYTTNTDYKCSAQSIFLGKRKGRAPVSERALV